MTSTLQQEASRKLRFSAQQTMRAAQRLYENGYITYMRTDSTSLSESAIAAARDQARELYGADSVPAEPRQYNRKVKNAQEAHEAIRPAGDRFRTLDEVAASSSATSTRCTSWSGSGRSPRRWPTRAERRSRCGSARPPPTAATPSSATAGTVITFRGFLLAYEEGRDEPAAGDDEEKRLPPLAEGDALEVRELEPDGHSTTPPARYTEATLVRALEERGIGRPSTYAAIMGTILDRGYVRKEGQALVPSFLAFAVTNLLEQHFARLVDYEFTARMEDDLDRIAAGTEERSAWLRRFYFGNGDPGPEGARHGPRRHRRACDQHDRDRRRHRAADRPLRPLHRARGPARDDLRRHRAGRADRRARRGDPRPELASSANSAPIPRRGTRSVAKTGRYGPYVTEVVENGEKPRTASIFKTMSPETLTLEDALLLLSLPRSLGADPADGEEVIATNGRYGPYVKKGAETRSLESEEQLLTITIDEALALLAQPKQRAAERPRRRRCASWELIRSAGSRSWSRTVASARTSPTVN